MGYKHHSGFILYHLDHHPSYELLPASNCSGSHRVHRLRWLFWSWRERLKLIHSQILLQEEQRQDSILETEVTQTTSRPRQNAKLFVQRITTFARWRKTVGGSAEESATSPTTKTKTSARATTTKPRMNVAWYVVYCFPSGHHCFGGQLLGWPTQKAGSVLLIYLGRE
jgi:hypothetical protein